MSAKVKDMLASESIRSFVRALPKVELHCHLEGAIWPEMLLKLASEFPLPLPSLDAKELAGAVQVGPEDKTLLDFLKKFELIGRLFVSEAVVEKITDLVVRDAASDGVRILELRFAPCYMAESAKLDPLGVARAVLRAGRKAAADTGLILRFVLIAVRNSSPPDVDRVLEIARELKAEDVVGFDLAGDEANYPAELFREAFAGAKSSGFRITVHAGEAAGASSVNAALRHLGAERIGHGVRSNEDKALIEELRSKNIPLEMCLTSNHQTGAVPPGGRHPFKDYLAAGLKVSLNTDDPAVSGVRLSDEFRKAIIDYDLTVEELKLLLGNAINASFVGAEIKRAVSAETADFLASRGL